MTRSVALLVIAMLAVACQTTPPKPAPKVPEKLLPWFRPCAPGDGAAAIQAFRAESLLGSAELAWVAQAPLAWELELTNPLGGTLLSLRRKGAGIRASGSVAAKMPQLAVDHKGFILADGHFVGIQADEIPCLLKANLPQGWLPFLRDEDQADGQEHLVFADGQRRIEVTAPTGAGSPPKGEKAPARPVCATIRWRHWWLFHSEIALCLGREPRISGEAHGLSDERVSWVSLDEPKPTPESLSPKP